MIRYRHAGREQTLVCDYVVGCDGFHRVTRRSLPEGVLHSYERTYLYSWLGILADAAPAGTRKLKRGPLSAKSVLPMRSQVTEPMRYGRVFMAGDAAHIVPPTGAKGLNLAFADVVVLARAFGHCGIAARLRRTGRELHGSLPGLTGPQPASGLSSFGSAPGNGVRVGHKP